MTTTETKVNASAISHMLGKTFTRSRKLTGRIRGYSRWTAGFSVSQISSQLVVVEYSTGTDGWKLENPAQTQTDRLNKLVATLQAAGYDAYLSDLGWARQIRVSKQAA